MTPLPVDRFAVTGPVCSHSVVAFAPGSSVGLTGPAGAPPSPASALRGQIDVLFKEHAAYVARLAYRLLGRDDEIDDIVQDVFIALFRNLEKIRQAETMRAWLGTTTVRVVRRRLRVRRIGFLLRMGERDDPSALRAAHASGEERAALWNIHTALEGVAIDARIAWVFRYLEEESVDDVARLCACSRSTAKRRIAEAHRVVKKAVSDD